MGRPKGAKNRPLNSAYVENGVGIVPLGNDMYAKIDPSDVNLINGYGWSFARSRKHVDPRFGYAVGSVFRSGTLMHRFIMGFPDGQVDHINGDPLDNRRANLRVVTRSENMRNKRYHAGHEDKPFSDRPKRVPPSGHFGVYKRGNRWIARIEASFEHREHAVGARADFEAFAKKLGYIELNGYET